MNVPGTMRAMVLDAPGRPLECREVPVPEPDAQHVLIRVHACGACRTDLHIVDGELRDPKLPLVLGHQVVGTVVGRGREIEGFHVGDLVGVPWLGRTCGRCRYCASGRENLCDEALFTGYTLDGGFADYAVAHQDYVFSLPEGYGHAELAPLLCAGLIGYRTYRMAGEGVERLGIYGFGAAAHIVAQIAAHQGKRVYAFTREGDTKAQQFALRLGAVWAGASTERPPETLDAALIFAPVGALVPAALRACAKGATVVCGGIHMSDVPSFPYALLWDERVVRSVANLTRTDGEELLRIAREARVKTEVTVFPLERANEALEKLRAGAITGAAVLEVG